MPRNEVHPIPAGFISLPDYAKAHGLDLVGLACAVFRCDMKGWRWTIRKGQGVSPQDLIAIVVAADDEAPAYIEKKDWTTAKKDKPDADLEKEEAARALTTAKMAQELGITRSTVTRWLKTLGAPALRIGWSEEEYEEAMTLLRGHCAKTQAKREMRQRNRVKKEAYWQKPEGYMHIREAADRLEVTPTAVYYWVEKGWLPSIKEAGRWWVREGCVKPSEARAQGIVA